MRRPGALLAMLVGLAACGGSGGNETSSPPEPIAPAVRLTLRPVVLGVASPLLVTAPRGDPRLFIVERAGRVFILQGGVLLPAPLIDIRSRVTNVGERGLLSIAFDPDYATNGFLFVHFTEISGDIAVERFHVPPGVSVADANPLRILTIAHRDFSNHNGGRLAFGPDGFLFLSTGDGGGAGDPLHNGQNLDSLLGKLLRIDVAGASALQPYAIPPDNPFVGQPNRRAEIWAYGLRNPWRYAFDPATRLLYIADVGQGRREEVDVVPAGAGGLNYGWNVSEGTLCFPADPCNPSGVTLPITEYAHDAAGGCSITGGFVYRGAELPELRGRYFYSDLCSGWLRSFLFSNGQATLAADHGVPAVGNILAFGEDDQGELYLTTTTTVYQIVRQP